MDPSLIKELEWDLACCKVWQVLRIYSISFLIQCIRPEARILLKAREEIGDRRCGDMYDVAHFANAHAEIVEPLNVSKPAECRNYSLRCTLCSGFSVHPFRFSPSADVVPTLSRMHVHFLALSVISAPISLGSLDLLYLAYPAATIPHLHALIPVHTDSGYLRESIPHRQGLPCIMPGIFVSSFAPCPSHYFKTMPKGHFFSWDTFVSFIKYIEHI